MALIGLLYAPFDRPTGQSRVSSPAFRASFALASAFVVLVALSYGLNPAWMWMYYVDPQSVSVPALLYVLIGLYALPWIAGYAIGLELIRRSRNAWRTAVAAALVMEGWLLAELWDRYNCLADYQQFLQGECRPLLGSTEPLALVLNLGGLMLVGLAVFLGWRLKRQMNTGGN